MRKSTKTETLVNQFASSYQTIPALDPSQKPFVYVDHDGNVKLLTDMVDGQKNKDGIFAVSVANDGWMEFLAFTE